jgi:cytochrome bd-type quinol oxidase subunit 2
MLPRSRNICHACVRWIGNYRSLGSTGRRTMNRVQDLRRRVRATANIARGLLLGAIAMNAVLVALAFRAGSISGAALVSLVAAVMAALGAGVATMGTAWEVDERRRTNKALAAIAIIATAACVPLAAAKAAESNAQAAARAVANG